MLKHVTFFALLVPMLCGCRTPEARRVDEGNEIARAACDYIVLQHRIPGNFAALRSYAKGGHYAVRWNRFSECVVHPISANGVRVDFVDVAGVSEWRIRFISARNLAPFVAGPATSDLVSTNGLIKFLTDPKAAWMLYH